MVASSNPRGGTNLPRFRRIVPFGIPPIVLSAGVFLLSMSPEQGLACACGCGVFDVATSSMFPTGAGGMAFAELDYQNQHTDWSGNHEVSSADNGDKQIATYFMTAGLQYMFNRAWGIQGELPYWNRTFKTDVNYPSSPPDIVATKWSDIGDIRVRGIYTGFSEDLSTGITFGLKLPTGNYTYNPSVVDRDSQIGTGSTDILLGGFHRGILTSDNVWSWFAQIQLDQPVFTQADYRPGTEIDGAVGAHYNAWTVGNATITPLVQVIVSERTRDSGGASASPVASGYQRVLLSPGIEADIDAVSIYADAEVPVYANVKGDQLVAPVLLKLIVAYSF